MSILLDMRTIVFSNEVIYIICMLVILFLWHQSRKRFSGTGFWVFFFAFQTTAVFLLVLRGSIPDWMSIVFANVLVIGGLILGYMGIQRFVGKKTSQVHNYVLLAVFASVHNYFALIQPNLALRSVNFSVMLLIISFQCMWFLVYGVEAAMRRLTLGVGMVFGAYCLVSIARIIGVFIGTRATNDLFQSGTFEALVLISYQVLFILLTYSLVLMVNKRLLMEVKTEEDKFAKAFRSSPYAITLTRLSDGKIIEVNDGFSNISGYQYAEAIGKTTVDLHLWDKEEDRLAVVNELSKSGKTQGREFEFRKKSGEKITGLFSAEVITINNQESVLSSISDITERKRAEEALRESEEKYKKLVKYAPAAIYEMDLQGTKFLSVNEAMCDILGYSREELLSTKPTDLMDQESRLLFKERIRKKQAGEKIDETIEYRIRRKDGEWIDTAINVGAITYTDEKPGRVVVIGYDITERKKIEQALRQSEERYRHLVQHAPAGIYEIDFPTGRFTEVNDVMCQILGYTRDELLAMTAFNILDDKGKALFAARIRLGRSGGRPNEAAEYLVRTKDGRLIWALLNITFRWDGDKIIGATVVAHDITERKRAEKALRENQTLLNAIMESTPDPVYVKDDQSRIVMANPALAKVVGKPLEEILGRTDTEYYGDLATGQALREHDLQVMKSGQGEVMEETVPTPHGYRTFLSSKTPYRNASGDIIGITGISRDITERKRIEEQLRQAEEKSRLLIKYAPSMLYEIDFHQPVFKSVNDAMCQFLGYTREELLAMSPFDLLDDEGKAIFRERIRRKLAGETISDSVEYKSKTKDGREVYGVLNMTFTYKDGNPEGAVVVGHDITERKQAEEALRKAYEELEKRVQERTSELSEAVERLRVENIQRKRLEDTLRESENQVRFFASQCLTAQETERKRVAGELHDSIATALAAMKIRIEKVTEEMQQGHGSPESLQDLSSKVTEVNNEVRRIMADLRPSILDDLGIIAAMNWFCREYQKTYSHISVEKQIDLPENDVSDSLKTAIFRVSQEAMNNIAKHSQASHVSLSLQERNSGIELTIQDNGQGFDLGTVRRGLGLSTMRERAQLSGGSFDLESAIGKGTLIRVSWPL